ncbi:MAG: hypothetical protein HKO59_13450 [Phycisphaerales bacterium]|nr:right-handed parallel beta-helix repeat-containing protein [Phycisphaerae bacterium]NNM26968.1 hypothetical protein [Phycisphaerales bacterium]
MSTDPTLRFGWMVMLPLLALLATRATAAERHVPGDHASIQGAIDAATAGDHVVVAAGTYAEAIDLRGKAITVRSTAGAKYTTIDATGANRSVVLCTSGEGPDTVLEGFTLTGGVGTLVGFRRQGGGMYNQGSAPTVVACIFRENTISAWDFDIQGSGGGMYNESADPLVVDCVFEANALLGCSGWLNGGAGIYNDASSPTIVRCLFIDNYGNNGSGLMAVSGSHPIVASCHFRRNVATYSGGGINLTEDSSAVVTNSIFVANTAFHGAGLYGTESVFDLTNSTITANTADRVAGGLYLLSSPSASRVENCIFWQNDADQTPSASEILGELGPGPVVTTSIVTGGYAGAGNRDEDPQFVDADGPDDEFGTPDDDLRLNAASPAVDTGDTSGLPADVADLDADGDLTEPTPLDHAGAARITGGVVDLGAHEFGASVCTGDVDGNGIVEFTDLMAVLSDWGPCAGCATDLDGDGVVGFTELLDVLVGWGAC